MSSALRRALKVADADSMRIEELLMVLRAAERHAETLSPSSGSAAFIANEIIEVERLLNELREIKSTLGKSRSSATSSPTALASQLAALAAWQGRVLNNPVVARARMHTAPAPNPVAMQRARPHVSTGAHSFARQPPQCGQHHAPSGAMAAAPLHPSAMRFPHGRSPLGVAYPTAAPRLYYSMDRRIEYQAPSAEQRLIGQYGDHASTHSYGAR